MFIANNQIRDITPLETLTELSVLNWGGGNQISDISPLESLSFLEVLGIDDNPVSGNEKQIQELTNKLENVEILR